MPEITDELGIPSISPKQLDFIVNATARVNLAEGTVRSGKSYSALIAGLDHFLTHDGPYLLTGKTKDTIQRNIIDPWAEIVGTGRIRQNKAEGLLHLGGKLFYVVGANDEKSESKLRGMTVQGWLADEVTLYPKAFLSQADFRMSKPGSRAFWTTNPDSPYHHVHADWIQNEALRAGGRFRSWHFELDDNPALDDEYKDHLKSAYSGLYYKRFVQGLWVLAEGAIYDMFQETQHVVSDLPERFQRFAVGIDYGTTNPTCFLLLGMDDDGTWYVVSEYYWDSVKQGHQKTDEEYADDFTAWLGQIVPARIWLDPSAASFRRALRKRGFHVRDADNAVLDGIRTVASMLSLGTLKVHDSCQQTVRQFMAYVWDAVAQRKGEDRPMKQDDHAMDALRYAVRSETLLSGRRVTGKPEGW